jgi:signal transduction histidine kinase
MSSSMKKKLGWYFRLYNIIAVSRLKRKDLDPRPMHTLLATVLSTGILMWSYAFLAYYTISSPLPGIVGFTCALIHLLSPFLFRFSNNVYAINNVMLASGMVHQATFAYHTGGFTSFSLKWLAILPMLGGLICGGKGAITWGIITLLLSGSFLALKLQGYPFPMMITENGLLTGHALIQFGWIGLSSVLIGVYIMMRESTERILNEQSNKVDELFRVLFHDLANPLGRLDIGLTIAKRQKNEPNTEKGLNIASKAIDSMIEITQSIKKMYVITKEMKGSMEIAPYSLSEAVEYTHSMFQQSLEKKNITLEFDQKRHEGLKVFVEPISFKNQVLSNIISNAIKFSNEGSKIIIEANELDDKTIALEVKDSGIGIPQNFIEDIFDFSKNTSRYGTKGETGTGLGMQIMKSFIEMYDGQVKIESQESQGTTIKLLLKGEWEGRPS